MRAIWGAALGAVLLAGSAQAGSCKLDGASLKAEARTKWSSEIQRPDLVGRVFKVERVASRWRAPKVAEISVLIRSGADAFLVRQISDFSGLPADAVYSTPATPQAIHSVKWGRRAPDVEQAHFSGEFDGVASGPLGYLGLTAQNCT